MRPLRCLFGHRWNRLYVEEPNRSLSAEWSIMFGNCILHEECERCGKMRERLMYAPATNQGDKP